MLDPQGRKLTQRSPCMPAGMALRMRGENGQSAISCPKTGLVAHVDGTPGFGVSRVVGP